MGGSSFATGPDPLFTPRMPPAVYHATKARLHLALLDLYICVASPIDGPAKSDFGDVDIMVTWPRGAAPPPASGSGAADPELLGIYRALGAVRMTCETGTRAAHYAIPWPADLEHLGASGPRRRHIQVDVAICASLPSLQWSLFKHAHGDLWNIVGSTIRPLGLTVDEVALWIRVPEIEGVNRNRAKVRVTDDPVRVLNLLGLEVGRFWEEPFASFDDLYEYAATSPMFWVRPAPPEDGGSGTATTPAGTTSAADPAVEERTRAAAVEEDRRALKSNDRRRMNTRPCYRAFVEDFIPRCRAESRFGEPRHTRSSVASLVFSLFAGVEPAFLARRRDFAVEQQRNDIWRNKIKGFVAGLPGLDPRSPRDQTYRGCLAKALKAIILEDGAEAYGVSPRKRFRADDGGFIVENVVEFIEEEHEAVGEVAMRLNNERYAERLELKELEEKGKDVGLSGTGLGSTHVSS